MKPSYRRLSCRIEDLKTILQLSFYKLQLNNAHLSLNVKFIKTFHNLKASRTTICRSSKEKLWTDEFVVLQRGITGSENNIKAPNIHVGQIATGS